MKQPQPAPRPQPQAGQAAAQPEATAQSGGPRPEAIAQSGGPRPEAIAQSGGPRPGITAQAVQPPECHDEVCITCSDTAVAVTIARLLPDGLAVVDTEAGQEEVSVALVDAGVGDTILVHAGEAIAVVPA
jgi:hydrogenase expression/formation protein HypC